MKLTRRETLAALAGTTLIPSVVLADSHSTAGTTDSDDTPMVHEVLMLNANPENKRERQVFYPDIVRAKVGDTIKFISEDRGHNSEVNEDMMPEGGTEWSGKINEDVEVTIEVEGAYGYYCTPHQSAGMVGLLLVGDVSGNYEGLKDVRQRGRARQRWEEIFERADALLAEETA